MINRLFLILNVSLGKFLYRYTTIQHSIYFLLDYGRELRYLIAVQVSLTKMQYMAFLKKADIFCQAVPTLQHRVLNSANSFGTRAPFFFLSVWFCGLQKLALFSAEKNTLLCFDFVEFFSTGPSNLSHEGKFHQNDQVLQR